MSDRIVVSWSSGKDAAWTLHALRQHGANVFALVTAVARDLDRVPIHGVRRCLVRQQALAAGLPLIEVELPSPCSNAMYEFGMGAALSELRDRHGVSAVAFGDIHLREVREYRERQLRPLGLAASFPLWGTRTDLLARRMLHEGLTARVVSLDPGRLDRRFAGRSWDLEFLDAIPPDVDPCGEGGEFHTLVTGGPMLGESLRIVAGELEDREGVVYADFAPPSRIP